jgi:hypothetical protein
MGVSAIYCVRLGKFVDEIQIRVFFGVLAGDVPVADKDRPAMETSKSRKAIITSIKLSQGPNGK